MQQEPVLERDLESDPIPPLGAAVRDFLFVRLFGLLQEAFGCKIIDELDRLSFHETDVVTLWRDLVEARSVVAARIHADAQRGPRDLDGLGKEFTVGLFSFNDNAGA